MSRARERPHVLLVDGAPPFRRWVGKSAMAVLLGIGGVGLFGLIRPTPAPYTPAPPPAYRTVVARQIPPSDLPAVTVDLSLEPTDLESAEPTSPRRAPAQPVPDPVVTVRREAGPPRAPAPAVRAPVAYESATLSLPPGRLFISSRPWGRVYVDDALVGNTPISNVPLSSGPHRLRIVRDGFRPYERELTVAPEQAIRLIDIVLEEIGS